VLVDVLLVRSRYRLDPAGGRHSRMPRLSRAGGGSPLRSVGASSPPPERAARSAATELAIVTQGRSSKESPIVPGPAIGTSSRATRPAPSRRPRTPISTRR
jgi:hypothetical protein